MRHVFDLLGTVLFWVFVFGLFFVFSGEPDLWDKWHAQAMGDFVKCTK